MLLERLMEGFALAGAVLVIGGWAVIAEAFMP